MFFRKILLFIGRFVAIVTVFVLET